jgi:hypothetical protein
MDDLSGLDWSSSAQANAPRPAPAPSATNAFYPPLRSTPSPFTSGRNTPLSGQASGGQLPKPAASKPTADSFSNLVNFGSGSSRPSANLSLREQQERLEAEKRKKEADVRRQAQAGFGDGHFLDSLGSGNVSRTASPAIPSGLGTAPVRNGTRDASDDDLFAAFNKDTQVDNASFYPPPPRQPSATGTASSAPISNLRDPAAWDKSLAGGSNDLKDDDDPFGLGQIQSKAQARVPPASDDDEDDLLGDLAKPVDQVRRKTSPAAAAAAVAAAAVAAAVAAAAVAAAAVAAAVAAAAAANHSARREHRAALTRAARRGP